MMWFPSRSPSTGSGRPWIRLLFCEHHDDDYPEGDEQLDPCAPPIGRNIGMDFSRRFLAPPAGGERPDDPYGSTSSVVTPYASARPRSKVAKAPWSGADLTTTLTDSGDGAEALVLQGGPIGEPIAQYGPFVMNTKAEIQKAYHDYQETHFGGWPWPADVPHHGTDLRRFARHADGREEGLAAVDA